MTWITKSHAPNQHAVQGASQDSELRIDEDVSRPTVVDLPADPVGRLEHPPGRVIQCDLWFPAPKIAVGFGQEAMPPVLVMVARFSRFIAAVILPSRQTTDLVAGMWQLLSGSSTAVPHELWWDNDWSEIPVPFPRPPDPLRNPLTPSIPDMNYHREP